VISVKALTSNVIDKKQNRNKTLTGGGLMDNKNLFPAFRKQVFLTELIGHFPIW
jgi:hypothetical protein